MVKYKKVLLKNEEEGNHHGGIKGRKFEKIIWRLRHFEGFHMEIQQGEFNQIIQMLRISYD